MSRGTIGLIALLLAAGAGGAGCSCGQEATDGSGSEERGSTTAPSGVATAVDGKVQPAPGNASAPALSLSQYRAQHARWRLDAGPRELLGRLAGYNLVLVVVDGLRADLTFPLAGHRSGTGASRITRLLQGSQCFTRAFSSGAGTDVGMTSVLTGRLHYLYQGRETLARALSDAGLRTHGVYQTEVERWLGETLSRQGHRGRRVLVNDPHQLNVGSRATSRQVSDEGIRFIQRHGGERFFLWLHYFDVHEHHQVDLRTLSLPGGLVTEEPATPRQRYELMLRHVDHHLGRFLDALQAQGLAGRTLVLFTADHGEGLSDSPRLPATHGELLYQALVHVPLALYVPGLAGRSLDAPVSVADIYPSLLDLAGLPSSAAPGDGVSLAPLLLLPDPAPFDRLLRPLFLMESHQQAVVLWPLKLIAWQDRAGVELYDLARDPREAQDLSGQRPEEVRRLTALLQARRLHRVDRRRSYVRKGLRSANREE